MTRPLVITTRTHPHAVGVYSMQVVLGIVLLIRPGRAGTSLAHVMGSELWASAWMGLIIAFASTALASIFYKASTETELRRALTVESACCFSLFMLTAVYVVTLILTFGRTSSVTISFVLLFCLMDIARAVQAILEQRRMDRALHVGAQADPSPLAEAVADHASGE